MLRVGFVQYINALPFHMGLKREKTALTFDFPTTINQKLQKGDVDLALVSTAAYFRHDFARFSNFGIAAEKTIRSVTLYTKETIQSLDGVTIGLTLESATSVNLLKILSHFFWNVSPHFVPLDRDPLSYNAFLLIGDEALLKFQIPGYRRVDLAQSWYEMTQLPFVFAVFASKKGTSLDTILDFENELSSSLEWAEKNEDLVVEEAHKSSKLAPHFIRDYYRLCKYRLGEKEKKSLTLFRAYYEKLREIESQNYTSSIR